MLLLYNNAYREEFLSRHSGGGCCAQGPTSLTSNIRWSEVICQTVLRIIIENYIMKKTLGLKAYALVLRYDLKI